MDNAIVVATASSGSAPRWDRTGPRQAERVWSGRRSGRHGGDPDRRHRVSRPSASRRTARGSSAPASVVGISLPLSWILAVTVTPRRDLPEAFGLRPGEGSLRLRTLSAYAFLELCLRCRIAVVWTVVKALPSSPSASSTSRSSPARRVRMFTIGLLEAERRISKRRRRMSGRSKNLPSAPENRLRHRLLSMRAHFPASS